MSEIACLRQLRRRCSKLVCVESMILGMIRSCITALLLSLNSIWGHTGIPSEGCQGLRLESTG